MGHSDSLSTSHLIHFKSHLHKHFQANHVYDHVKNAFRDYLEKSVKISNENDSKVALPSLRAQDLAELLLKYSPAGIRTSSNKRPELMITIKSGSDFAESATESDEDQANFIIVIIYGPHRFCTRPVPVQSCPDFHQTFTINLLDSQSYHEKATSFHKLLHSPEKLFLVLFKEDRHSRLHEIISSQEIEWRGVLESGTEQLSIDLYGPGDDMLRLPVGKLNIQLQIGLPVENVKSKFCDRATINKYVFDKLTEKKMVASKFKVYVKSWWAEYIQIRNDHHQRIVKLFVTNESNESCFVCSILQPIYDCRAIPSPAHAARFVRMIPCVDEPRLCGENQRFWTTLPVFLSRGHGAVEEHCALLCSLFLGFGLSAYICYGKNRKGPCTYVMTKESRTRAVFWDSVTGLTYPLEISSSEGNDERCLPFDTIGCVFNHQEYYANIQIDYGVQSMCWDFSDLKSWKPMASDIIRLSARHNPVRVLPCTIDPIAASESLEIQLKQQIEEYRRQHLNVETNWDDALSHSISPALVAYESQFITGNTFGNALFQQAIKNLIPIEHIFQAYPAQFDHIDSRQIMAHLINEKVPSEILSKTALSSSFAIRTYIVPYAEQIAVTWIMLAIRWKQQ